MMKIEVPKSLFEYLARDFLTKKLDEKSASLRFIGPYGDYEILSKPDEEFTEEVIMPVRRYKESK